MRFGMENMGWKYPLCGSLDAVRRGQVNEARVATRARMTIGGPQHGTPNDRHYMNPKGTRLHEHAAGDRRADKASQPSR
jgi:hypothetical protein